MPPGIRTVTLAEVKDKFAYNAKRIAGDIFARLPEPPYHHEHVTDWQKDGRNDDVIKGILRVQDDAQK